MKYEGGCHCGALGVRLETQASAAELRARLCGCTFCKKHAPRWGSDPNGTVTIAARKAPMRYRFGQETADFVLCQRCGVLVAAACVIDGRALAVVNLNVFDEIATGGAPVLDHDGETRDARLTRRRERWTPLAAIGWGPPITARVEESVA